MNPMNDSQSLPSTLSMSDQDNLSQAIPRTSPTSQFQVLHAAFDHFNRDFFGGTLPHVMLTMDRSRRKAIGVFSWNRFESRKGEGTTHEICLNPKKFKGVSDEDVLSTLLHEMIHLWQFEFARGSRSSYHNREWADKMESLGLIPTDTGKLGGKRTGTSITHLIVEGGPFQESARRFLEKEQVSWEFMLSFASPHPHPKVKKSNVEKAKRLVVDHTCPRCGMVAKAPEIAFLICGVCQEKMLIDSDLESWADPTSR